MVDDDAVMNELGSIIEFSIPKIKDSLQEGSVIYELVESHCEIALTTVGILVKFKKLSEPVIIGIAACVGLLLNSLL